MENICYCFGHLWEIYDVVLDTYWKISRNRETRVVTVKQES